ncbi:unnamed protein product [Schistosoma margrebowiei]|uniref:Uncharacterized protein n=1 Tax=Schistosoma margrebowiei TaxID=48269 RepID=A0A3P8EB38_9TREM|nr:unnamed protein product [Schistosoma margrebowiei]
MKLDHHGKPESIGRPFRPVVGLLSSAHPRPRHIGCRISGPVVKCSRAEPVGPGFKSRKGARSWMHTAEESHNRTKRPPSASRYSV